MSEILKMIILGIVQGLTEFLPVSSSGHLILLQDIFGIQENVLFNTIILHFGTLLAVVIFYFRDLIGLLKKENHKTIWQLLIATIPACILGLLFGDFIETYSSTKMLAFTFLITATVLILTTFYRKKQQSWTDITTKTAVVMGLSQCIALFPGISRSGSTISGGVFSKSDPKLVTKFSFFMSIPIIFGSLILECFKVDLIGINWLSTLAGLISAFISGIFAIKLMMKVAEKCNFKWFGIYLIVLSLVCFINEFVVGLW
ncbi:MAG: undecaprenyl-diphosphate phosphatase [Clostridia bacterium]|nr:undecaprenyl-diphosphate phosphatase [Clostridia bacterium]